MKGFSKNFYTSRIDVALQDLQDNFMQIGKKKPVLDLHSFTSVYIKKRLCQNECIRKHLSYCNSNQAAVVCK